jgi:hypothetical protein
VTRSLAAAIAYDTEASVVVVDLTFRRPTPPAGVEGGGSGRQARGAAGTEPIAVTPGLPPPTDGGSAAEAGPDGGDAQEPPTQSPDAASPADAPRQLTLADAVEHGASVDDIIIQTGNPRLCMIAAGGVPVARRPALAQGRPLASVLDQLDERFDHVLLDLPPVLVSSDAMNLSQLADAYVLVVRHGVTSETQVEAALDELQGGETLGVILNRFDSAIPKRLRRLVGT